MCHTWQSVWNRQCVVTATRSYPGAGEDTENQGDESVCVLASSCPVEPSHNHGWVQLAKLYKSRVREPCYKSFKVLKESGHILIWYWFFFVFFMWIDTYTVHICKLESMVIKWTPIARLRVRAACTAACVLGASPIPVLPCPFSRAPC